MQSTMLANGLFYFHPLFGGVITSGDTSSASGDSRLFFILGGHRVTGGGILWSRTLMGRLHHSLGELP